MKTWNVTWSCDDGEILIGIKVHTMRVVDEKQDELIRSAIRKVGLWLNDESFLALSISTPTITKESNEA